MNWTQQTAAIGLSGIGRAARNEAPAGALRYWARRCSVKDTPNANWVPEGPILRCRCRRSRVKLMTTEASEVFLEDKV